MATKSIIDLLLRVSWCQVHSPGVIVVSHVGVEVPQQNNGVPRRGTIQHPRQGRQEGRVLRTTTRPVGRNDSQRPVPNPKAQGCDPLIHWGKPQHETAELGGNKQTHPSPRLSPWATPE
ncbi:hypothetical protein ATANTOWER_023891 [Ataeniobius toweri]|uniref:Secreted protein n=1 Tax=Ataeniobius toweri TaxID=208326 RepID=A0ABU7BB13_9TELE|nr:hypothetical protein [Ataeniobius toweri]